MLFRGFNARRFRVGCESEQFGSLNQEIQNRSSGQAPARTVNRQNHAHGTGDTALGVVLQLFKANHQADVTGQ